MDSQKQETGSLAQPTQSPTFSEALQQSLRLLGAAFRQEITEQLTIAYAVGLEGLEGFQIIRATRYLLANHEEFLPTPAQVRKAVSYSAPREPTSYLVQEEEQKVYCGECNGTGWKLIDRPDGDGQKWAVICDCRKKKVREVTSADRRTGRV